MEEDIALERHFKSIIDPLKQKTLLNFPIRIIMIETFFSGEDEESKSKRK